MTREECYKKLSEVFDEVFDEKIILTDLTKASDVQGWDSLTHITLVSLVEDTFDMKFTMKEVLGMKNVGEMVDIILREC